MTLSSPDNNLQSNLILNFIAEERQGLGASQLAMGLVNMLEEYLLDDPDATVDGAKQLLDSIHHECNWAKENFDTALTAGNEAKDFDLARKTVCKILSDLQIRFGAHFTREGGLRAIDDLTSWATAIKKDLLQDTSEE